MNQQQTEAIFAIEHLHQCIGDFIKASQQASMKWKENSPNYPEFSDVESDLLLCQAYATILRNVNFHSFKVIHIIAQQLEEF